MTMGRQKNMQRSRSAERGFTLIELMIAILIVAIIAAIAYPSYRKTVLKAHRTDAKSMLTQVAQQQERWFTRQNTYAANLTTLGYSANTVASDEGYYTVTLTIPGGCTSGTTVSCFQATATATGGQADDTDCRTMTIDEQGQKTATDSSGAAATDCW